MAGILFLHVLRMPKAAADVSTCCCPVLPAAMFIDLEQLQADLATLGLDAPTPISATSGDGMADLHQLLQPVLDPVLQQYNAAVEAADGDAAVAVLHTGLAAKQQQQKWQRQQMAPAGAAAAGSGILSHDGSDAKVDIIPEDGFGDLEAAANVLDDEAAVDQLIELRMMSSSSLADSDDEYDGSSDDESSYLAGGAAAGNAAGDGNSIAAADVDQESARVSDVNGAAAAYAADTTSSSSSTVIPGPVRLAILGLPNAGKSTLMNQLLGYERSLTGGWFKSVVSVPAEAAVEL